MSDGAAAFWDKLADRYAAQPVRDQAAYETKLRKTQEYLEPHMSVLEFGCGTGTTAITHAPHVAHILATDASSRMLEIAQQRANEAGVTNVDFNVTTIEGLTAPPGAFDAVLALNILHLVEDVDAVLAKTRELLKPGGLFVSSTVCLADGMGWLRLILPILRLIGRAPDVRFLKAEDFVARVERAGFEIEHRWQPGGRMVSLFLIARVV